VESRAVRFAYVIRGELLTRYVSLWCGSEKYLRSHGCHCDGADGYGLVDLCEDHPAVVAADAVSNWPIGIFVGMVTIFQCWWSMSPLEIAGMSATRRL